MATRTLPSVLETAVSMAGVRWALAIGSGIGGLFYPTATAISTIPGFDTPEEQAARRVRAALEDARRVVDSPSLYDQDRIRRGELPEYPSDPSLGPVPSGGPTREPTEFGQRVLDAALSGNLYDRDWLRDQIGRAITGDTQLEDYAEPAAEPELYEYTPTPQVSAPPTGVTAPPTQTVSAPAPRGGNVVRRIVGAMSNPAARYAVIGLGVVGAIQASRRGRGGKTASPIGAGAPIATPPLGYVSPLTAVSTYSVGSSGTATRAGGCSCATKKRGPKRKCLERGSVAWRTGRFKGKAAGSKCIRFARS